MSKNILIILNYFEKVLITILFIKTLQSINGFILPKKGGRSYFFEFLIVYVENKLKMLVYINEKHVLYLMCIRTLHTHMLKRLCNIQKNGHVSSVPQLL